MTAVRYGSLFTVAVAFAFATSAVYAAFQTTVTKAPGFDASSLDTVVIVAKDCHEVVDCSRIIQQVEPAVARRKAFSLVPEAAVRQFLFSQGATAYTSDHRAALAEHFEADAVAELSLPFAERGDGYGGRRGSQVKVELTMYSPAGEVLVHGVGTGRPVNVVTSPERVAGNVVEELLSKIFE